MNLLRVDFRIYKYKTFKRIQLCLSALLIFAGTIFALGPGVSQVFAASPFLASNVLGQSDPSGNPLFTTSDQNNNRLPASGGLFAPNGIAVDTVHHELYVADSANNWILVYNLDTSNNLTSNQPAYILGQPDFNSDVNPGSTQSTFWSPEGLAIDTTGNRLFVADTRNSRVLVFDISHLANGLSATAVLGWPDFNGGAPRTTQDGMSEPTTVAYDPSDNRLFVGDDGNGRVLVYNVSSIINGMPASYVIGKPSFTSSSNCTASSSNLCHVSGLAYDDSGKRLFVSDGNLSRVLVFNVSTATNGMVASNVLGQSVFTTHNQSVSQSGVTQPGQIAYDASNNRLFVTDVSRVLVYPTTSITDGENAVNVIGQADFTSDLTTITQNHINNAVALAYDPTTSTVYTGDTYRLELFAGNPVTNGENAFNELGQTDQNGANRWTMSYVNNNYPNAQGMNSPTSVVTDDVHHRLYVMDCSNNRVLVYDLSSSNQLTSQSANYVIGQSDFFSNGTGAGTTGLNTGCYWDGSGLTYDASRGYLFVSDSYNNRVLVYDTNTLATGMQASYVIGQTDFTSTSSDSSTSPTSGLYVPTALAFDEKTDDLFVADNWNDRIMVFDTTNITNGMDATAVIGQPDFTTDDDNATMNTLGSPVALALDETGRRLFVADSYNSRVLVFNIDTLTNGPDATTVLGQSDFTSSNYSNTDSQTSIGTPTGLAYDSANQQLYVADYNRILTFDMSNPANNEPAMGAIGQPGFTTSNNDYSTTQSLGSMFQLSYDAASHQLFAPDFTGNRIMVFDTLALSTNSLISGTVSSTYDQAITAANAQGSVSFDLFSGSLPPGLSLDTDGTITGTPTAAGTYQFTVRAFDNIDSEGTMIDTGMYNLTINPLQQSGSSQDDAMSITNTNQEPVSSVPTTTSSSTPLLNTETGFTSTNGTQQELSDGQSVQFYVTNPADSTSSSDTQLHTATVLSVGSNFVNMEIHSQPIYLQLFVGHTYNIDINHDGHPALSVYLASITGGKANLVFRLLPANTAIAVPATTKSVSSPSITAKTTHSSKRNSLIILVSILAIASVLISGAVIWKQRNSRTSQ